jgi:fibronectin-binding autotransporter adhesin
MQNGTLNGNLDGPGMLRIGGTVNWTGGLLANEAVLDVPQGGRLNVPPIPCCSSRSLGTNASIVNDGTLYVANSNGTSLGANFRIQNNGTFEVGEGTISGANSATIPPLITNAGTIVKTAASNSGIGAPVWNKSTGVVKADSGTVTLSGGSGGTAHSGTFAGGVVLSGTHPLSNVTFTGAGNRLSGTHALASGTTTTIPAGVTVALAGNVEGPGKLLIGGTANWTSGQLANEAVLDVPQGGRLNVPPIPCCASRSLGTNASIVNDGTLYVANSNGTSLGANFRIQNNGTFEFGEGNVTGATAATIPPLITNAGTIVKTAPGNSGMYLAVLNQAGGTIKSNAGELQLHAGSGGTPHSGTFAGGVVLYGAHPLSNASFTATGNKLFGTHALANGTTSTIAPGATATLSGFVEGPGKLLIRGTLNWTGGEMRNFGSTYVAEQGHLNVPTTSCCSNHAMGSNYSLVNDGLLTVGTGEGITLGQDFHIYNNGTFTWEAGYYGDLAGTSTSLVSNSGTFVKTGYDRGVSLPMENDGTFRIDTGMTIHTRFRSYSRTKNILKEGEYVLKAPLKIINLETFSRNAARITLDGTAAMLADNAGVNALRGLTRNAGGGRIALKNGATLTTLAAVRNAGKITVEAGSTLTTPGYTQVRGATVVDGSTAKLNAGTAPGMSITGGSLRGTGVVQGNVTNSGGSVMPGGTVPGQLSVQGTFTQTSLGSLDFDVGGLGSNDSLAVSGAVTLGGRLRLASAPAYSPVLGDSFTLLTYASQTGAFASFSGTGLPGGLTYAIQLQPQSTTAVVQ